MPLSASSRNGSWRVWREQYSTRDRGRSHSSLGLLSTLNHLDIKLPINRRLTDIYLFKTIQRHRYSSPERLRHRSITGTRGRLSATPLPPSPPRAPRLHRHSSSSVTLRWSRDALLSSSTQQAPRREAGLRSVHSRDGRLMPEILLGWVGVSFSPPAPLPHQCA